MNEKLNNFLKMASEVGSKAAKALKDMDAPAMAEKLGNAIRNASKVSNQYSHAFTGMDAATLLNRHVKPVAARSGLPALAAVSLLAMALRPTEQAAAATPTATPAEPQPEPASPETPSAVQIDQRIVGRWRHTWAKGDPISGMSLAVDDWLILNADGTCQVGSSRAAGGKGFVGMDTGRSELARGFWRAESKTLYVSDDRSQWAQMGKYCCDGSSLLVKSGGNKIYHRQ